MIGIVDYGMGNLQSVCNALNSLNVANKLINTLDDFTEVTHLIIPGVGSFAQAMENLKERKLLEPIKKFAQSNKPILGICLGMQLLATIGHEPDTTQGIGLIDGEVKKFSKIQERIPHVGWNSISLLQDHYLFEGIKKDVDFYFVHSYYFDAKKEENVLAYCNYGIKYPAIVFSGNIIGIQFHPEKSQKNGLKILYNFYFNGDYA